MRESLFWTPHLYLGGVFSPLGKQEDPLGSKKTPMAAHFGGQCEEQRSNASVYSERQDPRKLGLTPSLGEVPPGIQESM